MAMTLTLSTTHLYFILTALAGIIGWWLAYYESSKREALDRASKSSIEKLIESHSDDKKKVEESCNNALQSMIDAHNQELFKLNKEHSEALGALIKQHESELQDIGDLGLDRLKEVEDKYSEALQESDKTIQTYEKYMTNINMFIKIAEQNINDVEKRESYNSDDELGDFFRMLQSIKDELIKFKVETGITKV